jgi:hypothetical protein
MLEYFKRVRPIAVIVTQTQLDKILPSDTNKNDKINAS